MARLADPMAGTGTLTTVQKKKKEPQQVVAQQATAVVPAQTVGGPADIQGWMEANRAKLEQAYAAAGKPSPWQQTTSVPSAVSKVTSQAVKIPSVPSTTYNPYTDPRFARMMQQLEQAISSPFQPKVEETPQYQAAQASLQRQAGEQAKRAVQEMAARNILRSSMTEQAYKDIAEGVTEALQTQVAPQVYQQLLGERQQQIQNLMSQLQAALSVAGFGSEEQANAFQQALQSAQLQENIRQANIMRQLQEAGITGYYQRQPTLAMQQFLEGIRQYEREFPLQEAQVTGRYGDQQTLAAQQLAQEQWWRQQQLALQRQAAQRAAQQDVGDILASNLLTKISTQGYGSLTENERLLAQTLLKVSPPQVSEQQKATAFQGWAQAVMDNVPKSLLGGRSRDAIRRFLTEHLSEIVGSGLTLDDVQRLEEFVAGK